MSTNSAAWQSVVVRFNARVQKTDSCWLWTAKPKPKGYGQLTVAGRSLGAHVVAWMIANNTDIAPTLWVLHTCDNRLCVNPDHLFLGTCIDNLDDMWRKGRAGWKPAILKPYSVAELRSRYATGLSKSELARNFGVSRQTVRRALNGEDAYATLKAGK